MVRRTLNSVDSVSLAFCFFFDYRPRSLASRHKKLNGSFIPIGLNIKRCLFKTDLFITDPALITDHSKPTTFITDPFITDNANMSGLLWTWSVMNGSVMNVVCLNGLVMNWSVLKGNHIKQGLHLCKIIIFPEWKCLCVSFLSRFWSPNLVWYSWKFGISLALLICKTI